MAGGWKDKARQGILAPRVDLKTFPERWIQAKKFSVSADEEIRRAEGLSPSLQRKIAKQRGEDIPDTATPDERRAKEKEIAGRIVEAVSDEEFDVLVKAQNRPSMEIIKLRFKHGIGRHNFTDDGSDTDQVPDAFIADLMEFSDTVDEILDIIKAANPPPFRRGKSDASSS